MSGPKRSTVYEWIRETIDEHGDILNTAHYATRKEAEKGKEPTEAVGLTRDVWDEFDGLVDRLWAYVREDGTMPEVFSGSDGGETGYVVPARFRGGVR